MEELSRECLMETLDVFSRLKRIGGSEDEHRACGYRSEEHTSELQSRETISYAVF